MPATSPFRLLPAALLSLALVACGGQDAGTARTPEKSEDAAPPVPAVGTCWDDQQLPAALGEDDFADWVDKYAGGDPNLADSMRDDAAFTELIDCAEPHSLEVYNMVELVPDLDAKVLAYADLLDQESELYRKVRDQVNDRCVQGSPYGKAMAKAEMPVQLGPALNPAGGVHVAWDPVPADLWDKGQRQFVCTFEQDRPGTLRFADVTTSKLPIQARVCLNTPGRKVSCEGRHQAEDIGEMVLNTAIEKGLVNGRMAVRKGENGPYVALSDPEYARLDKVCAELLRQVSKGKDGVEARAYPGSVEQWPTEEGAYVASCFALKPFEPPPPVKGTVFNKP